MPAKDRDPPGAGMRARPRRDGPGGPSGSSVSQAYEGASTYTLMQMNLCLSGFAGCYGKVAYPAGVEEAVARIRDAHPDAVTLNETCRGDVARIARRTGYHLRFSTVTVSGEPLACVRPGGRGRFGDAVLTKAAIESTRQPRLRGAGRQRVAPVAVRRPPEPASTCAPPTSSHARPRGGRERRAVRRARRAPRASSGHPHGHLRGRRQPKPRLRPRARLDPDRRLRRPGPGTPVRLRKRRAPLALGGGDAGHAHRPRRPAGPRATSLTGGEGAVRNLRSARVRERS